MRRDGRVGLRIVLAQEFQRAVGKHHAEAEGGVGGVLLEHGDVGVGLPPLDQIGEIEAGGPRAENGNAHGSVSQRVRPDESGNVAQIV